MHYLYLKKQTHRSTPWITKFLPTIFVICGLLLIGSASLPIFFYKISHSPQFQPLVNPLASEKETKAVLGDNSLDLTRPANWFAQSLNLPPRPSKITHYSLSIPKLKIEDAIVQIGGDDLKKTLVQYEGTAHPGQFGNTVIFGHSVLPQFFNPKNYLTIFSTLPTLKKKDEILIDFDGVSYRYLIFDMVEVEPTDISVLEQHYDDYYLTLVTCVPPGTYFRRLAVKARLTR